MKNTLKKGALPFVSICLGIFGLALRCWLFSTIDANGLLPQNHIAGILSFVLLAIFLFIDFLATQNMAPSETYSGSFPPSMLALIGGIVSAIGIAYSALITETSGLLQLFMPIFGILSAGAICIAAYCRLQGQRPNCLLHCVIAVYLILRIIAYGKIWGAEPQLQLYFFPLLSCLFLLLACYFRAEQDVLPANCRMYMLFSQAALFCCLLSVPNVDWVFYLSATVWMATDYCVPNYYGRYAA